MASATSTITQGPLAYDKPKGLAAFVVPILCPPTDFMDMQKLLRLCIRGFVGISVVLVSMSFVVVPAWLWLIRHEAVAGHTGDALAVGLGGVLIFLAADATSKAVANAAAARRSSLIVADAKLAANALGSYPGSGPPAGTPLTGSSGIGAHGAGGAVLANGLGIATRGNHHAGGAVTAGSAQDPVIRQAKLRVIRLEHLVFGNEINEAELRTDALHDRVLTLCREVGVPFGGPGGSGTRATPAELDQQLQILEKELLGM